MFTAVRPFATTRIKQRLQLLGKYSMFPLDDTLASAFHATPQPLVIKWLEKVIHRVNLKGAHRILIRRRREDDVR